MINFWMIDWEALIERIETAKSNANNISEIQERNIYLANNHLRLFFNAISHPSLSTLDSKKIEEIAIGIFLLLISNSHPQAKLFGKAYALLLRRCIERQLDINLLAKLYDCAYGLFWVNAQSLIDMADFDSKAVKPFSGYIRSRFSTNPSRVPISTRRRKIVYLCHYAHLTQGNAVAPIIASLARDHSALEPEDRVSIVCPLYYQNNFSELFEGSNVKVFSFPDSNPPDVGAVFDTLSELSPDIVITDISSGVSTFLFERRIAPIQMWLEMGYPYWSIQKLDWTFLGHKFWRSDFGVRCDKCSPIRYRQSLDTVLHKDAPEELSHAKLQFQGYAQVLGWFGRFSKVTTLYLNTIEKILSLNPDICFVIAGSGDPSHIRTFINKSVFRERFIFINSNVNVKVYSSIISAFIDTFPFCGGNVARELTFFDVPVITLYSHDWPLLMNQSRDPALLAHTPAELVSIATRLLSDNAFRLDRITYIAKLKKEELDLIEPVHEIISRIHDIEKMHSNNHFQNRDGI